MPKATASDKLGRERRPSSKRRIAEFLIAHIGEVVTSKDLRDAAGQSVSEWARRVRELREEGWPINTHHDSDSLKVGEYLLTGPPPEQSALKFDRKVSSRIRAAVLDRNGFTCQMCGLTPGDTDPLTQRKVRLHVGHIIDRSLGGKDELSNLRTLCSSCNQGAKNLTIEKPSKIWLLSQVRRAGRDEQLAVFEWLGKKFK